MIEKYTAQAKTQEEAIEKGLKELNISRSEAEIEINQAGKKGFLGFGAKDAVVTVKRKNSPSLDEVLEDTVPTSNHEVAVEDPAVEEMVEESDTEVETSQPVESEPNVEPTPVVPKAAEPTPSKEVEPAEESIDKDDPTENPDDLEAIEYVRDYLSNIITHMGIDDATVSVNQDDSFIQYDVETEDAGLVIGRHGKVLNGLQTLAQIQLHQRADNKLHARVDAENYRNRRKDTVEHLAKKTARQVLDTNQSVILEPMPAHERKQIHRYLSRYDGVQTHSEGQEPHRYLVVEPKNK